MEIAEFLLARIAEDEAVAKTAYGSDPSPWVGDGWLRNNRGDHLFFTGDGDTPEADEETTRHIARWDPARVLAECEARRQVVQGYREAWEMAKQLARAGQEEEAQAVRYGRVGLESALVALALPYADHPDYDPKWKL